jgi:hypothetical protein
LGLLVVPVHLIGAEDVEVALVGGHLLAQIETELPVVGILHGFSCPLRLELLALDDVVGARGLDLTQSDQELQPVVETVVATPEDESELGLLEGI